MLSEEANMGGFVAFSGHKPRYGVSASEMPLAVAVWRRNHGLVKLRPELCLGV